MGVTLMPTSNGTHFLGLFTGWGNELYLVHLKTPPAFSTASPGTAIGLSAACASPSPMKAVPRSGPCFYNDVIAAYHG